MYKRYIPNILTWSPHFGAGFSKINRESGKEMVRWVGQTVAPATRNDNGWAHNVRSYVVGRGVKDLRTGIQRADIDAVLGGDIDCFLTEALVLNVGKARECRAVPE